MTKRKKEPALGRYADGTPRKMHVFTPDAWKVCVECGESNSYFLHTDWKLKAEAVVAAVLKTPEVEKVDHPAHYGGKDNPYEAIKVIEAWKLGFCLGNAVKYISRAGKKGDACEDLEKAIWYLQREVDYRLSRTRRD
jgi:hypothetical protein